MRKYLKNICSIVLFLILIIQTKTFATSFSSGYVIENYDIDMIVNENNVFDITETITVDFSEEKHGIYRKIPLKNYVIRQDGTFSKNKAQISNISVNEKYTTSKENGYEAIKIGDSNKTLTGVHTYIIKYTYNIGKDPLKDADELYYNLIGTEWDTSIKNVTFKITMPKEFEQSTLGFSTGKEGSTDSSNVLYTVENNIIKGSLSSMLLDGQALTVRLTLPEGYFIGAGQKIEWYPVIVVVISLACVIITIILWKKYGKDEQVIETVEFYPPEGYNSAEVGFLYNGSADTSSIISLLIYLADKGYLKIEEEKKSKFVWSKGFKITKLKEYDGNNEIEKIFFNGLFANSKINKRKAKIIKKGSKNYNNEKDSSKEINSTKERIERETVTDSDLRDKFYITIDRIKAKLNSNKKKIFVIKKRICLVAMMILIYFLITFKPAMENDLYGGKESFMFGFIFSGIGFSILIGSLVGTIEMPKIFAIIWGASFGGGPWAFFVLPALIENPIYLIMYFIGIVCVTIIMFFIKIMPKRTAYGNEMLGKIRGFRKFLKTAEKEQLESLVEQNPEYFYNILPYTYALGVSSVWVKQFEKIAYQAPDWYDSSTEFNANSFSTFMNATMASAKSAMTSYPSTSGGGGSSGSSSSGGGFSGGGSGGGGGSSW